MVRSESSHSLHSFLEDRHDLSKFLITISRDLISISLLLLSGVFFYGTSGLLFFDFFSLLRDFNLLNSSGFSLNLYLRNQDFQIYLQSLDCNGGFS
jgi:hypothetical protein